jgi:hypothetical protein
MLTYALALFAGVIILTLLAAGLLVAHVTREFPRVWLGQQAASAFSLLREECGL